MTGAASQGKHSNVGARELTITIQRSLVTFRNTLSERLKRHERLRRLYNRAFEPERFRQFEITDWVRHGVALQNKGQLPHIELADGKAWVRLDNGLVIAYLTEVTGAGLDPQIYQGTYEPENTAVLDECLHERAVFIDIGANVGWFSLHAAKRRPSIQVHAFEPGEFIRSYLQSNIQRNALAAQIGVHAVALSEHTGTARFTANQHGHALNHLQSQDELAAGAGGNEIETLRLDDFVARRQLDRVDLIKCDVEGAELLVLRGATETLAQFKPTLLIEVSPRWSERYQLRTDDLEQCLRSSNYAIFALDNSQTWQPVDNLENAVGLGADILCKPINV